MKSIRVSTCLLPVLLLCAFGAHGQQASSQTSSQPAAVPHLVKFGGNVKDASGKPLTGSAGLTFALYKDDQGGAALWIETQSVPLDSSGHYSVMLGATKPDGLPTDLFTSGEARWLGVQPEGQAEQSRVLLLSVPYALKAGDAATLGGLPPSAFIQANHPGGQTRPPASATASLPAASTVQGSGTLNFLPIWTGTTTIGNSTLFEKSGKLGLGTTTPATTLDVKGAATIRGNATVTGTLSSSTSLSAPSAGFTGSNASQILSVTQKGTGAALSATTAATASSASAISGTATSTTGQSRGVAGYSDSNFGVGVQGFAGDLGVGASTGVYGASLSSGGTGVYGSGSIGVAGSGFVVGGLFQANSTGVILKGLNSSGTSVFSVDGRGTLSTAGNSLETFIGDPGCGGGTAAIGFGSAGFLPCSNYALRGDSGGNLYINSSSTGWMFFDHNNTGSMALDPSGNLSVNGSIGVHGNIHISGGLGVPNIVATFNQSISGSPGQNFTLYTPPAGGLFRVSLYWVCSQGGNSQVFPSLSIYYTSYINTQQYESVTSGGPCASAGGDVNSTITFWAAANNPIQAVVYNPPESTQLIISIEQLM